MKVTGTIRYIFTTSVLAGSAPHYFLFWAGWRGISLILPEWMYQIGDDFLYSMYQRMVVFFFEHCTQLKVYLSGDQDILSKKENVLYLGNHQSTVDWIVCNMLAVRQGSIGHLRYVMKDTLQILPLYGFYFYQHGCIYVKRGNFKQHKMEKTLEYLQNKRIKSWVVVFPEGTRFVPEESNIIEKSRKAALESGITPLDNHLTPRYRGSYLTFSKLRSNLDAIYDITVVYSGTLNEKGNRKAAPQLIDFLMGKCPEMFIHVKRIPIEDVPVEEMAFKDWMYQLFADKEKIVYSIYNDAKDLKQLNLSTRGTHSRLSLMSTLPSFLFFFSAFIPMLWWPEWTIIYLQTLLLGTLGGYSWLAFKAVC